MLIRSQREKRDVFRLFGNAGLDQHLRHDDFLSEALDVSRVISTRLYYLEYKARIPASDGRIQALLQDSFLLQIVRTGLNRCAV